MKKLDWLLVILLCCGYLVLLLFKHPEVYSYRFNPQIIDLYLRSQDIPKEVYMRVHIPDSDIYIGAGYLYATGASPTAYNYPHPPLIKYLFGYSILLFDTPNVVQILLGMVYVALTYLLGKLFSKKSIIAVAASLLLIIDPVFLSNSSAPMLDLGQSVLALGYVLAFIFAPANFLLQGVLLGFLAASKFWSTAAFFVFFVWGSYYLKKKKFPFRLFIKHLLVAGIAYSAVYLKAFLTEPFIFNLPLFQLKMLKYMFHHNSTSFFGSSIVQYLTGYYYQWWDNKNLTRVDTWTFIWPLSFIVALIGVIKSKLKETKDFYFYLLPVAYLVFLGAQVPFPRYFLIILPYFYVGLVWTLYQVLRK